MGKWQNLTAKLKALVIKFARLHGVSDIKTIRDTYNLYSSGNLADNLYASSKRTERGETPNYNNTISEQEAERLGYFKDNRGHRDDRVKLPNHPTHPSRGTFLDDRYDLSDKGIQDVNYTLFGLVDNGDSYAIPTYKGSTVLPEITVTPDSNYVHNTYDNIKLHYANGGNLAHKYGGELVGENLYLLKLDNTNVSNLPTIEPVPLPTDMWLTDLLLAELNHKKALYENEGLNIVSPEFELLTLFRSLLTAPFTVGKKPETFSGKDGLLRIVNKKAIQDAEKTGIIRGPVVQLVLNTLGSINLVRPGFEYPFFSKDALAFRPLPGEVIIQGGKNTYWTPLKAKQRIISTNAPRLSYQEIMQHNYPFATPYNNGVNSGLISDFIYYDRNLLGNFVPRNFYTNMNPNYELFSPIINSSVPLLLGASLDSTSKSTGGPLYPFSFEKNPYLKTPIVRYDEGGFIRDWDSTLTGKLINYVENSDSIGWVPQDRTWEHPTLPGYDKNQIGMGVDKNETKGYAEHIKYRQNGTPYLTEKDERVLRHAAIEKANTSANARYKFALQAVNRPEGTISKVKDAAVVSAIYNLGATYVANGLFEDKDFMLKLFDGTDLEVVDRINLEYKKKKRNERIAKTNLFLFKK